MRRDLLCLVRWAFTLCALPFLFCVFLVMAFVEGIFEAMETGLNRKGVCHG